MYQYVAHVNDIKSPYVFFVVLHSLVQIYAIIVVTFIYIFTMFLST